MSQAGCRHEVYFSDGHWHRLTWANHNCGITIEPGRITWQIEGRSEEAAFDTIAAVHLESGGGDWQHRVDTCRITFRSGEHLTISDLNQYGLGSPEQRTLYRAFVRDLHGRLAEAKAAVDYTAGYGERRYNVVVSCAVLLGVMSVALPFVLVFVVQKLEVLYLLVIGIGATWPLYKMVAANAPRHYDPRNPPAELME